MGITATRRLGAEALGTALLMAVVIGSGIMGERLTAGNAAVALLANSLATVGGLVVLIEVFGPISGAHFNPAVSLVMAWAADRGERGQLRPAAGDPARAAASRFGDGGRLDRRRLLVHGLHVVRQSRRGLHQESTNA